MTMLKNHIASVLTLPLVYAGVAESTLLPARRHFVSYSFVSDFTGDTYSRNISYDVDERSLAVNQLATLHQVAAALLSEATDVDPEIVAAVNQEFWNLLV